MIRKPTKKIGSVCLFAAGVGLTACAPAEEDAPTTPEEAEAMETLGVSKSELASLTGGCPVHVSREEVITSQSTLCVWRMINTASVGYADCAHRVRPLYVRATWKTFDGDDVSSGFQGSTFDFTITGDTKKGEIFQVLTRRIFLDDIDASSHTKKLKLGSDVPWLDKESTTGWSGRVHTAWRFCPDDAENIDFRRLR